MVRDRLSNFESMLFAHHDESLGWGSPTNLTAGSLGCKSSPNIRIGRIFFLIIFETMTFSISTTLLL